MDSLTMDTSDMDSLKMDSPDNGFIKMDSQIMDRPKIY